MKKCVSSDRWVGGWEARLTYDIASFVPTKSLSKAVLSLKRIVFYLPDKQLWMSGVPEEKYEMTSLVQCKGLQEV